MGQQFEFKLDERDVSRPRRFEALHDQMALPALIAAEAGAAARARSNPVPVKARRAILPRDIAAEDAFRLTLLQCKWHIASNVAAIVDGHQVEGIHQMRVGFRRLRVALTSFGGDFRTPALEALRARAQKLSEKLGPARDLDVFVEELLEPAAQANGAIEAFDLLRQRAGEARVTAWNFAVAHVLSPAFASFMHDLGDALDRRIWFEAAGRAHASKGHMAFEMPASEIAKRMLAHRLKDVRKRAKKLKHLSDQRRHKLRIALKKLRYTAEFFAPLYDEEDVGEFLKKISNLQDILGALNDVAVARDTLQKLTGDNDRTPAANRAALSFAAGVVYGWHLDRASHIWKKARKRWKQMEHTEPFWHSDAIH
ncbi:MAG: CHAD domain-containing protein [Proteobacteria bacterium]|nr:CHAD domain-containing protein [Pseudomonadota bacterium]